MCDDVFRPLCIIKAAVKGQWSVISAFVSLGDGERKKGIYIVPCGASNAWFVKHMSEN